MRRLLFLAALLALAPAARAADEPFRHGRTDHYDFEWRPDLDGFARHLMEEVEAQHARIYGAVGADPDARTHVTLVDDPAGMRAIVQERDHGLPPEWAAGLAFPEKREIYLQAAVGLPELEVTLQHEIVHVALGVATDDVRVPRWFHEGLAIRLSEGLALERIRLLTEAALMDGLIDLDRLDEGFPASGARAGVAYAQAVHFVGFLRDHFGDEKFQALMRSLHDGGPSFAEAVQRVYGQPLSAIEQTWRKDLRLWWGWIPVIFGSTTLWVIAAFLLVAAWRRRRAQARRRLERLQAIEAIEMRPEVHVAPSPPPPAHLHDPYDGRPPTIH
jgi:hypothetical protein